MEQNLYIRVKDQNNNWNIWQVVDELKVDGQKIYKIHSRTTDVFIEKEYCFCEYNSSLLYYENGDKTINIEKSNIEHESKKEYGKWKMEQSKNINPFKIFEEVDFGYLEDAWEDGDWDV